MDRSASLSPGRALMSEGMESKDRLVEEILLLALFIVSTAANSLALLVFCRRPGLRTISNRFVINLLATNLLTTCLLAPALFGEHSARGGPGAATWAEAGDSAAAACGLAALLAVTLIALDQHHAVTDPLRCHTRLLQRRPAALCAAAWLAAALAAAARSALAIAHHLRPNQPALQVFELTYYVVYLLLGVIVPITVVCVMYARIYRAARSSGLRARAHGASALQLHEPPVILPDLVEEGEGLTLKIDERDGPTVETDRKFGPFLLPPERPVRCPSVASLRASRRDGKSTEDLRKGLPAVSSAPLLAAPLLAVQRAPQPATSGSRITSIRCRISNASLFRYREESRAARVGLLTGALVMLHVPHAVTALLSAAAPGLGAAARTPALALLLLASAASPFLFALRSRRVQREARRLLLPQKSGWERTGAANSAVADGQRARAALDLLRTLSPGEGEGEAGECAAGGGPEAACRGSFSSGGSTQLSSASEE
ncbi:5-hydroxytryptamine receptor 1A-alpha [Papilio machaon]|uniref:5-hydroxytryptamine receptor 1A-alpha n=1 Tax=Papilio machaon TaxID=76193 RepID=UPI001E665129|nr:5-hydroxytryptamine receptor 1A-alpha [Papilio machaon]